MSVPVEPGSRWEKINPPWQGQVIAIDSVETTGMHVATRIVEDSHEVTRHIGLIRGVRSYVGQTGRMHVTHLRRSWRPVKAAVR